MATLVMSARGGPPPPGASSPSPGMMYSPNLGPPSPFAWPPGAAGSISCTCSLRSISAAAKRAFRWISVTLPMYSFLNTMRLSPVPPPPPPPPPPWPAARPSPIR